MKAPNAVFSGRHWVYLPLAKYKKIAFTPSQKKILEDRVKDCLDRGMGKYAIFAALNASSSIVFEVEDVEALIAVVKGEPK